MNGHGGKYDSRKLVNFRFFILRARKTCFNCVFFYLQVCFSNYSLHIYLDPRLTNDGALLKLIDDTDIQISQKKDYHLPPPPSKRIFHIEFSLSRFPRSKLKINLKLTFYFGAYSFKLTKSHPFSHTLDTLFFLKLERKLYIWLPQGIPGESAYLLSCHRSKATMSNQAQIFQMRRWFVTFVIKPPCSQKPWRDRDTRFQTIWDTYTNGFVIIDCALNFQRYL